jgi:CDP-paratose 2-epimerase
MLLLDSLSRAGVERTLNWLRETHGARVRVGVADVHDPVAVTRALG